MTLTQSINSILFSNLKVSKDSHVLVVYDLESELSKLLSQAYKEALAGYNAEFLEFKDEESAHKTLLGLNKGDFVILIQSTSFRISKYRIRLELNQRGIYCIEHVRLAFIPEIQTYIDSLAYDFDYYKNTAQKLKELIEQTEEIQIISSDDSILTYSSGFEEVMFNIGDFSKTLGSLFPIGETFTEPKDISKVNGEVLVRAYPNTEQRTEVLNPFKVVIKDGCIVSHKGPAEFEKILTLIREAEGKVCLREMGFGLNKAITFDKPLYDISSFERMCGFHISLGKKHNIYRAKFPKKELQKYHIDMFPDTKQIRIGSKIVFENGRYIL